MKTSATRVLLLLCLVLPIAGAGCSKSSSNSSSEFCKSVKEGQLAVGTKDIDGQIDVSNMQAQLDRMVAAAPPSIKADAKEARKMMLAFAQVTDNKLTPQEFKQQFPDAKLNALKSRLNAYIKPNCGFSI